MKTITQFLLAVCCVGYAGVATAQTFYPDSSDYDSYNGVGMAFDPFQRTAYQYDANNNVVSETVSNYVVNTYTPSARYLYLYNGNNTRISATTQQYLVNTWVNQSKDTTLLDGSERPVEQISQTWTGGVWVNSNRSTTTYDGNGNISEIEYFSWNIGTSQWDQVGGNRYFFTYNGGNLLTKRTQNWALGVYSDLQLDSNVYNGNTRVEEITLFNNLNVWNPASRHINITWFDEPNGLKSHTELQFWMNNNWENSSTQDIWYFSDGRDSVTVDSTWNMGQNQYEFATRKEQSYYPNTMTFEMVISQLNGQNLEQIGGNKNVRTFGTLGEQLVHKICSYNQSISAYDSVARYTYYYPADLDAPQIPVEMLTVFPNPSADIIQMRGLPVSGGNLTVQVLDMAGRMVFSSQHAALGTIQVPVMNLETGSYIIRVERSDYKALSRFIKN